MGDTVFGEHPVNLAAIQLGYSLTCPNEDSVEIKAEGRLKPPSRLRNF